MSVHTTPDSYTKLLIHSDTADASTTFVDLSPNEHTITSYGDPAHSTTQKKFGKTSIYQDSSDDSFGVASAHADFNIGTQDWTLDFWWYPDNSLQGEYYFLHTLGTYSMLCLYYPSSGGFKIIHSNPTSWQTSVAGGAGTVSTGQWYHVAFVRASGVNTIYLNGQIVAGPTTDATDITGTNATVNANSGYVKGNFEGYVDEYRLSVGIARWTDTFVPPNKPYSVVDDDFVTDVAGIEDDGSGNTTFGRDIIVKSNPDEASTDTVFSVQDKVGTPLLEATADGNVYAKGHLIKTTFVLCTTQPQFNSSTYADVVGCSVAYTMLSSSNTLMILGMGTFNRGSQDGQSGCRILKDGSEIVKVENRDHNDNDRSPIPNCRVAGYSGSATFVLQLRSISNNNKIAMNVGDGFAIMEIGG